jgi:hypothetical protein
MPLLLVIACSGCSTAMLSEGWAYHSYSPPLDISRRAGYPDPIAVKTNGGVIFQYDAQIEHYGMFGSFLGGGSGKFIGKESITNFVASSLLRPATNSWWANFRPTIFPTSIDNSTNQPSDVLPFLEYQEGGNGHPQIYPSRECILWRGDWYWYVPPLHDGDFPMAALVSKNTLITPPSVIPLRIILFPPVLAGDIVFWPYVGFIIVVTGGKDLP